LSLNLESAIPNILNFWGKVNRVKGKCLLQWQVALPRRSQGDTTSPGGAAFILVGLVFSQHRSHAWTQAARTRGFRGNRGPGAAIALES
jgi:hypothetical protein